MKEPSNKHRVLELQELLTGTFVYAWKSLDEWKYVGKTRRGFKRLFTHHVLPPLEEMCPSDEIVIWACKDEEVDDLELALIAELEPMLNGNAQVRKWAERKKYVGIATPLPTGYKLPK